MTEFRHSQVDTGGSSIHVVEAGDPSGPPVVFLHGWPESWRSWQAVMSLATPYVHVVALDLPGIGGSTGEATDGSKHEIAAVVHGVVEVRPGGRVLRLLLRRRQRRPLCDHGRSEIGLCRGLLRPAALTAGFSWYRSLPQEEAPGATWRLIAEFIASDRRGDAAGSAT